MGGRRSQDAPRIRGFTPPKQAGLPLPTEAPRPEPGAPDRAAPYVRIVPRPASRPFSQRTSPTHSRITLADVHGDALRAFDIRDGDQLVLAHRRRPEHGDFVVLPLSAVRFPYGMQSAHGRESRSDDPLTLWKVYPEARRLRLSTGPATTKRPASLGETSAPLDAPMHGVLIGILRRNP